MKATEPENPLPNPNEAWHNWYQQFDQTHSPQQRREWYSQAAGAYRQARPRYPQSILKTVIKQANSTFENWPLPAQKFDAVLTATSFHWISPEVAPPRAALNKICA